MKLEGCIRAALEAAGIGHEVRSVRSLSGGCIHDVRELTLETGDRFVVKVGRADAKSIFDEEFLGLEAIARTHTVRVPQPLATSVSDGLAALLMSALPPAQATEVAWRDFGERLAWMHGVEVGSQYGFDIDNHLGSTLQPNTWCDDWVEFNAVHRLGYQLMLARQDRRLTDDACRVVDRVIDRLEELIPARPKPALLHGDLWSGNALSTLGESGEPVIGVIDPAPYVGDGWADIAMMRLFGGFPQECFAAYLANVNDRDDVETRVTVYQLYHVLNHANLFGPRYAGQAVALARKLTGD